MKIKLLRKTRSKVLLIKKSTNLYRVKVNAFCSDYAIFIGLVTDFDDKEEAYEHYYNSVLRVARELNPSEKIK